MIVKMVPMKRIAPNLFLLASWKLNFNVAMMGNASQNVGIVMENLIVLDKKTSKIVINSYVRTGSSPAPIGTAFSRRGGAMAIRIVPTGPMNGNWLREIAVKLKTIKMPQV